MVIPLDEPENVMAPVVKKKGIGKAPRQLKRSLSVIVSTGLVNFYYHYLNINVGIQQEASKSSLTATDPIPTLHVTDQGRFGSKDHLIPSAYVSSKSLQFHQTDPPRYDLVMISPAQPYVHDYSTS